MKSAPRTPNFSRRQFLRLAGMTAGGLLTGTALAPATTALGASGGHFALSGLRHLGVLLPASSVYPGLGHNFLAGLQVAATGRAVDIVTRETAPGMKNAYAMAQELLTSAGVRTLVGIIDPLSVGFLRGALDTHQATMLAVSLGENVTPAGDARVTYHSLDLVQAAAAFGAWAARSLGRSAVLAASCYDSGYDAFAAFRLAFEKAGGQVRQTVITHLPTGGPDLAAVMREVAQARPDFVYAAYSGAAALDWVRAYRAGGLSGSIPLAGSTFLADEALLASYGSTALGILTAGPGAAGDPAAALAFTRTYEAQTGRPADHLALLGYEAASILAGQALDSRPLYVREVQRQGGILVNTVRQTLSATAASDSALAALLAGPHTGWVHPYLSM